MAKKSSKLILVTGATGQQGGAALRHLRQENFAVRALTRNPDTPKARALVGAGTEVVRGDLEDPASLTRALDGVHGVYSVQSRADEGAGGAESEVRQGINLASAAARSRISHLVYSSVAGADRSTGVPHFDSKFRIEEHIRGTGLPFTILRPVFFMENWLRMRGSIANGAIELPLAPGTRLAMVAVDDIGAFVALAFKHPGKWQGRAFQIAGDELSLSEIAERFSGTIGREVRYVQLPWDEFERRAGRDLTVMYRWVEAHGFGVDIPSIRQEHPGLLSFDRWIRSKWQPAYRSAG